LSGKAAFLIKAGLSNPAISATDSGGNGATAFSPLIFLQHFAAVSLNVLWTLNSLA